jgi:hypothetical protein
MREVGGANMKRWNLGAGLVICSALALGGCAKKSPMPAVGTDPMDAGVPVATAGGNVDNPAAPVVATLSTDKTTYKSGEPVTFTLTARNAGNTAQNLNFGSGQSYDIVVRPQGQSNAEPLWQWSRGRMFTQALREITLNAGEQKTWTTTWLQTGSAGGFVPRGQYTVSARLTANGGVEAAPLTITLTE